MAQDFFELFGVCDDTTISTIDPAGVALLGVQALSDEMEVLKEQNKNLQEPIDQLKIAIAGLALSTDGKSLNIIDVAYDNRANTPITIGAR